MLSTICLFVSLQYGSWCFTPEIQKPKFDIHRLSYAVARQETGSCTTGTGVSHNNCHWIMMRVDWKRQPRYFNTKQESYEYFERMWQNSRYYHWFPTLAMAKKYVGESDGQHWLTQVTKFYNS